MAAQEGFPAMPPNPTRAEFFRREAARLHRLAEVATLAEVRVNLRRTARLYEAMARHAAETGGAPPPSSPRARDAPAKAPRPPNGTQNRGSS